MPIPHNISTFLGAIRPLEIESSGHKHEYSIDALGGAHIEGAAQQRRVVNNGAAKPGIAPERRFVCHEKLHVIT